MIKTESNTVKFSKKVETPALYRNVVITEKEADKAMQHGFGCVVMNVRSEATPQKGDVLNFKVVEGGIYSFSTSWHKLNDLAGTVINVQTGMQGLELGYVIVTFVLGDTIKVDIDVNSIEEDHTCNGCKDKVAR